MKKTLVILGILACFILFILGMGGVASTIDGWPRPSTASTRPWNSCTCCALW